MTANGALFLNWTPVGSKTTWWRINNNFFMLDCPFWTHILFFHFLEGHTLTLYGPSKWIFSRFFLFGLFYITFSIWNPYVNFSMSSFVSFFRCAQVESVLFMFWFVVGYKCKIIETFWDDSRNGRIWCEHGYQFSNVYLPLDIKIFDLSF